MLVLVLASLLTSAGCHQIDDRREGSGPLRPLQMSSDAVVLDLFFVRVPFGDEELNARLWEEVDEQHFPADVRNRLAKNGFRVGLVGSRIPVTLSKLLELKDKPAPSAGPDTKMTDLTSEPRVSRRHLQLRAGNRGEIAASGIYERVPVLICDRDGVSGQEYSQAQGLVAIISQLQPDGRVRLDLIPELQHGESRPQFVGFTGTQAGFRLEQGKPRRAFDELALQATLSPGDMVVLASLPNRPGSLGHHFFTQETGGKREQKLLVIRLSQTQHGDLFEAEKTLPLDVATR